MQGNDSSKPTIKLEGKMSTKDAGKVAIIMAWGKAIALVLSGIAAILSPIAVIVWKIYS